MPFPAFVFLLLQQGREHFPAQFTVRTIGRFNLSKTVPVARAAARSWLPADTFDAALSVGSLAALRSRARGGMAIGLMVTASHNPERDNGIKLIDPDGVRATPTATHIPTL